jgi:hypothetical protein
MRNTARWTRLLAFGLSLTLSLSAARKGTFEDSVREAPSILLGDVVATSSFYASDGEIYTDVVVRVRAKVKDRAGRLSSTLTFRVPGGEVGNVGVAYSETPEFHGAEPVMLLLDDAGQPLEKYHLEGDFMPDLGKRATQVLDELVETGEAEGFEPEQAKLFLRDARTDQGRRLMADPVCYALMGPKWASPAAPYKLDATLPAGWGPSVSAAASAWNAGGSPFRFSENSTSNNVVNYAAIGGSSSILAQTRVQYTLPARNIVMFTLTYNTSHSWSTSGEAGKFDVQAIGAHELGHALGLNHPTDSACIAVTMWASASPGETSKRTLEAGDKAGLVALYGSGGGTVPPPAPPPPAPAPSAPTLTSLNTWPSAPRANSWFYLIADGTSFESSSIQFVVKGPGCSSTGCIVSGSRVLSASTTSAAGLVRLTLPGSYTVAVRNGSTGTASGSKPLTVR